MKTFTLAALLCGLALATVLVAWHGLPAVGEAMGRAGWAILLLCPVYLPIIPLETLAWRLIIPHGQMRRFEILLLGTWISVGVNWLLPVAQVGGELVKARFASHHGLGGALAGASVLADKTLQAAAQLVFTLFGVGLYVTMELGHGLIPAVLASSLVFAFLIYLFYRAQRRGLMRTMAAAVGRFGGGRFDLTGGAAAIDRAVHAVYGRPGAVFAALAVRVAARAAMVVELWLALHLLGHPIGWAEALVLESMGQAVRAAAFFVPGGLGIQEGGFVLLGQLFGIGPETALALSLAKRVRELGVGLPALLVWQVAEGRRLMRRT